MASSTKLLPNERKTCYEPLCQGAVLAVGSPGEIKRGRRDEPQAGGSPVGPLCLHQEMWAFNSGGGGGKGCPPSDVLALWTPPLGEEGIKGTL